MSEWKWVACFVYGTLRVGGGHQSWAHDIDAAVMDCSVTGDLYFSAGDLSSYPVADLDGTGNIVGDVLILRRDWLGWQRIQRVESGAGYVLREVEARGYKPLNDWPTQVVAWHYPRWKRAGRKIPDGDWLTATGARV